MCKTPASRCLTVAGLPEDALPDLARRFGAAVICVAEDAAIPGSFWGEPEAGIVGDCLHVRADTPVHSALHELGHIVCMTADRRAGLDCDAGSDDLEECAVCYLQLVLADALPGTGRDRMMREMDAWGYSFRLGSTRRWFEEDAGDARAWLRAHGLLTGRGQPSWRSRP